jgi:hypothetical protein
MKKALGLVICILTLSSCTAMQAQNEEKKIVLECQNKWKNHIFDPIRGNISVFQKTTSTRYILVQEKASEADKKLLLDLADIQDECANKIFDFSLKYIPWALPALAESRERSLISFAELYNQRITYGEYNRLGAQSKALYLGRWQKLQAENARISIAAQRNQLQASQNLILATQQLSTPSPQLQNNVTHTNCHWIGRQIQCTSF